MDYYIKATDETSFWQSLESVGLAVKYYNREDPLNQPTGDIDWTPSGAFTWVSNAQLDVIGTIHVPTGETEEINGMSVPVMQAIDGYHANLRGELTEEQKSALPLIDAPATPVRVWA